MVAERTRAVELPGPGLTAPVTPAPTAVRSAPQKQQLASLMIEDPVRSGQSVVFIEGDVTVLGSVGSGAEIIAGGSIHVYGALRGRALAGVTGNARARIFCHRVEAELLAIDSPTKRPTTSRTAYVADRPRLGLRAAICKFLQ